VTRPQDDLWETLDELFGPTRTRQEGSRRGLCVRELRLADATPDEVRVTYAYCRARFTTFTEMALLGHLSAATAPAAPMQVDTFLNRILGERGSE
jgi:hypothetical protein